MIRVGGVPIKSLGGWHSPPTYTHKWPGGCWEASWEMVGLSASVAHPVLRRGALVEILVGTLRVWVGILDQPGQGMRSFTAHGLSREAERFLSLDGTGALTYDTAEAITEAIALGLPWRYASGAPAGVATDQPEYLHQTLDVAATAAGQRWGVGADGWFFCEADPTSPTYHAIPGSVVMGQADDSYATHLYGWHVDGVSGTPPVPSSWAMATAEADQTTVALYGRSAHYVDLRPRGLLTTLEAEAILEGMLTNGRARVGFTERLDLHHYQLMRNGTPAPLSFVRAGEMVRVHGAIRPGQSATNRSYVDMVIAESTYTAGSRTISLAPLGLVPRTLSDVLAVTVERESVA